jgi:hypothetical protein
VTLTLYSSTTTSLLTEGKELLELLFVLEKENAAINGPVYVCTALLNLQWEPFATVLLPRLVPFARFHWEEHSKVFIQLFDLLFQDSSALLSSLSSIYVTSPGLVRLHALDGGKKQAGAFLDDLLVDTLKEDFDWSRELSLTLKQESDKFPLVASTCLILSSIDVTRVDVLPVMMTLFKSLLEAYLSQMVLDPVSETLIRGEPKHVLGSLLGKVLETTVILSGRLPGQAETLDGLLEPIMGRLLPVCDQNIQLLEGIAAFLEAVSPQGSLEIQWKAAYEPLKQFLHSQDGALRTACLRILAACEKTTEDSVRKKNWQVLEDTTNLRVPDTSIDFGNRGDSKHRRHHSR